VGITGKATYKIWRVVGYKKVKTVNMQTLKPRHCGDGEGPTDQDQNEPGRDTRGRRIPNENGLEDKSANEEANDDNTRTEQLQQEETHVQDEPEEGEEDKEEEPEPEQDKQEPEAEPEGDQIEREQAEEEEQEANNNKKRYNLRKRKNKTVYVSALKIFRLDNIRDADNVIEAMKRGYKVSIGRSFFAGGGGVGHAIRANAQVGQQLVQDMDNDLQPPPEAPKMPPSQPRPKQPRMLSGLAMFNAPGIKDGGQVSGKRNQRREQTREKQLAQ
jgi:hypothetical protein